MCQEISVPELPEHLHMPLKGASVGRSGYKTCLSKPLSGDQEGCYIQETADRIDIIQVVREYASIIFPHKIDMTLVVYGHQWVKGVTGRYRIIKLYIRVLPGFHLAFFYGEVKKDV